MITQEELKRLKDVYSKTTQDKWEYHENDDGTVECDIPRGHSFSFDIEGSCGECFANMEFIALAHEIMPQLIESVMTLDMIMNQTVLNLEGK